MATTQTPSAARTADEVIQMFAELGLPVCDDGALIQQKFDGRRDYYLRSLRSPDPKIRAGGETGVRNGEALLNQRPPLLRVVYEQYTRLADTALKAAIATGQPQLTPELRDALRRLAAADCRCDDLLADQFVKDYLAERGIQGTLVRHALARDFQAAPGLGQIMLTWTLPSQDCEEIEIERTPGSTGAAPEPVYRGAGASMVDRGLQPGVEYVYRAYSRNGGIRSPDCAQARALCLGEVAEAKAAWNKDRMEVSWSLPHPSASVLVFRRVGAAPSLKRGPDGPVPADAETALVYRGSDTAWLDRNVPEGAVCHYVIVACFGPGRFSAGVPLQETVPSPPRPPAGLSAVYRPHQGAGLVALDWKPAGPDTSVEYLVVRREGDAPAGQVREGEPVYRGRQTSCLDEKIEPGRRYSYSVFSRAGDLVSRRPAVDRPVEILADVSDLRPLSGDGAVELEWRTPPNVSRVLVRRSLAPITGPADGTEVRVLGPGHARDQGLANGRRYHYRVYCFYRGAAGQERISPGVEATAVPEQPPPPVEDFTVRAQGTKILASWTPPPHGDPVVLRSPQPHGLRVGDCIPAGELDPLGERVPGVQRATVVDPNPDRRKPYYSIFTLAGSHAVVGSSGCCFSFPDVRGLEATCTRQRKTLVRLTWEWPDGCKAVEVVRRYDGEWPEDADDPQAQRTRVTRDEYDSKQGAFVDVIPARAGSAHYRVYTVNTEVTPVVLSRGLDAGCRRAVRLDGGARLECRVSTAPGSPMGGRSLRVEWQLSEDPGDFGGFVLVVNPKRLPMDADDGCEVYREEGAPGRLSARGTASLSAVRAEPSHPELYYRVFLLDPDDEERIAVSAHGCLSRTPPAKAPARGQAPKRVTCPSCLEQFAPWEMQFAGASGARPVTARRSLLERLQGHAPTRATGPNGETLRDKYCPNEQCPQRRLHQTAGEQEDLFIGLMGAAFSSKTTYVCSLIDRLDRIGRSLGAGLLPATDETLNRYQTLRDQLFRRKLTLQKTQTTEPPFVYDLTVKRGGAGRSATLVLYDTAGEFFGSAADVADNTAYLARCAGLILLVDPLQIDEIRDQMPPGVSLPNQYSDPRDLISTLQQLLLKHKPENDPRWKPPVLAVAMVKTDALNLAGMLGPRHAWSQPLFHEGAYDLHLHDEISGLFQGLMERYCPQGLTSIEQHFPDHAFFGVSSTGCSPDARDQYPFVAPWRVEEPLLWLLYRLGMLQGSE